MNADVVVTAQNRRGLLRGMAYALYPLILLTSFSLFALLQAAGLAPTETTIIVLLLATLGIAGAEWALPYRQRWKASSKEVVNDASFIVFVQVLLPQWLGFLAASWLIHWSDGMASSWPAQWPVAMQLLAMILLADFLRYWLHRAAHHFPLLWRFHAVHHSPRKLYWLNVGRFHPLEKALQFAVDALPFILLGIDQQVLSLYFLFYAINGFFQHANVNIRLGVFNFLISGPELHRWHHSDQSEESNRNFGQSLSIWDWLFGTFYWPRDRSVKKLGLVNKRYPTSFLQQLQCPFIPRLEKRYLPLVSLRDMVVNYLLELRFKLLYLRHWGALMRMTHRPARAQARVLKRILLENSDTRFGRMHHFSRLRGTRDFRRACPVQTYLSLKLFMQDEDGRGLCAQAAEFYQVTSGTTGEAKYLPLNRRGLKTDKQTQNLVALARYLDNPCTYTGKIFGVISPAVEGHLEDGKAFGSTSGLVYQEMPALARSKYVVPYEVFEIEDYDLRYRVIALFALAQYKVSIAATANPSTFVRLLEIINEDSQALLAMLEVGQVKMDGLPAERALRLSAQLRARPSRARELRRHLLLRGQLSFREIWPHLQQLVTWTGGSCGIACSSLQGRLPAACQVVDLGYLASEVRSTLTLGKDIGLPTLGSTFFEFIERVDRDSGVEKIRLLHELEYGHQYYVLVTTVNGLYRYDMNDIIEVTGFFNRCPTLKFIQKGRGVTNITGEKLYEGQVLEAVRNLEKTFSVRLRFQQWLAEEEESRYRAYLELQDGNTAQLDEYQCFLDDALANLNLEYQHKRSSGRLGALQLQLIKAGTGEAFKRAKVAGGQREGQFKTLILAYARECDFNFSDAVLASVGSRA